jgi:phenolic acid decarboxylase
MKERGDIESIKYALLYSFIGKYFIRKYNKKFKENLFVKDTFFIEK